MISRAVQNRIDGIIVTRAQRKKPIDFARWESGILPIMIRNDLVVEISGIPFDLTRAEAERIAGVILAMATEAKS